MKKSGISASEVKAIGVTNHRESTIVWDTATGEPIYNIIVWLDTRTTDLCNTLKAKYNGDADHFRSVCGLPISTYFSAMKLKWILENVPAAQDAINNGTCAFGTVESWIIWNLTGGVHGGLHLTEVTNASRTMLMNLSTCQWDKTTCDELSIPMAILPAIKSSAETYGSMSTGSLQGVPIAGCLGDQQAATLGQLCITPGQAKNTYGTGCFMLLNTGEKCVPSTHGLLSTCLYQLGPNAPVIYALEGSIAIAGAAISWLRDNMGIISHPSEINVLAASVASTGDVYFVPAFSGLFAPHWRMDARGCIVGLTQATTKAHLCLATLEAVCYQTREVMEAMQLDSGVQLHALRVDGGMSVSDLLLEIQAEVLQVPVSRPAVVETTAMGAAYAAGLAVGVYTLEGLQQAQESEGLRSFESVSGSGERSTVGFSRWKHAISKSLDWNAA